MNTSDKLRAMAKVIQQRGFYPYDLTNRRTGAVCFVEARHLAGFSNDWEIPELLTRYIPMTNTGNYSSVDWAITYNVSTEDAVEFLERVADNYDSQ